MAAGAAFSVVDAERGGELKLAMQKLWLTGQIVPVGARLLVRHVFRSEEEKPLEVIYCFGLPRDAALRRFEVSGEGFQAHSELKRVADAVKQYEEGIEAGHLATLARGYRDGLVNLSLGNLRPGETVTVTLEVLAGVELRDDGLRFRFPFTLAPAYHARAKAMRTANGLGEMELPEDEFGDVILPKFSAGASGLHEVGFDLAVRLGAPVSEIGSPSHAILVTDDGGGKRVALAPERDVPDRDLVLDVRVAASKPQALAGVDSTGRGHFVMLVPSRCFGERPLGARRVVLVIDRSGSMNGAPMAQARKAAQACLATLAAEDQFGLVAFDDRVETFRGDMAPAGRENRDAAAHFLDGIDARGGTELAAGFSAAAAMLGGGGGDVLVLTDGQVFGTENILEQARALNVRIHTLGIGSASQDRFLAQLASHTGGVGRFVTPRERVDMAALDLFASIGRPVASGIEVSADGIPGATIAPAPPTAVFSGTPLCVYGSTDGAGEGTLRVRWKGSSLEEPLVVESSEIAGTLRLLHGAKLVSDLESRIPQGDVPPEKRRERERLEARLEALSKEYGLASQRMALVAVVVRAGDLAGEVPGTRVVPVGMPQDTTFGSYFGPPGAAAVMAASLAFRPADSPRTTLFRKLSRTERTVLHSLAPQAERTDRDVLLELACKLEPDGGMPGRDSEQRILATIVALVAFLADGHTPDSGAFRTHVRRLVEFLEKTDRSSLEDDQRRAVDRAVDHARRGDAPAGPWKQWAAELVGRGSLKAGWRDLAELLSRE